MTQEQQLEIMRKQLSNFDTLINKVQYLHLAFDPDPDFSQEARDQIRAELCREYGPLPIEEDFYEKSKGRILAD